MNQHSNGNDRPDCLDVSQERLNSMSPSQLERAMEAALEAMTEESYDPAIIDAYLDALDRAAPMPDHPDATTSYADFERKIQSLSGGLAEKAPPRRGRRSLRAMLRTALVAALLAACLFGGAITAQAAGIDVLGALARWTDSAFSFGEIPDSIVSSFVPAGQESDEDIPEEYTDIKDELDQRGLPLYFPKVPEGFVADTPDIYVDDLTDCLRYYVSYNREDGGCIGFGFDQIAGPPTAIYEKDGEPVEEYVYHDVTHYLFSNLDSRTAAWINGDVEYYLIVTNAPTIDLRTLIQTIYSFDALPDDSASSEKLKTDIPEEYTEIKAELDQRGLPLYFPKVPEGFTVIEPTVYTRSNGCIGFNIGYSRGDEHIGYGLEQKHGISTRKYEKDDGPVEEYVYNGVTHYLFTNLSSKVAAWVMDNVEYSLSTNAESVDLKELIRSIY